MSEGGSVDSFSPRETLPASHPEKHQAGVHETSRVAKRFESSAGYDQRNGHDTKEDHHRVLGELRAMKKPALMAKGGEISGEMHAHESGEGPEEHEEHEGGDEELRHAMGHEFMSAMERKDKKGIMDSLEAIVLSMKGKE